MKRRHKAGALLLVLLVAVAAAWQLAAIELKSRVLAALGPDSALADIHLGFDGVVVEGLVLKAPRGWPAAETLRAERITVSPDLASLFSGPYRVRRVAVEQGYVSVLRSADGRLRAVPGLGQRSAAAATDDGGMSDLFIGRIEFVDSALEFFDASVRQPPLRVRLEAVDAHVDDVRLPSLTGESAFGLEARVKGLDRDGTLSLQGHAEIASRESDLRLRLVDVDLRALEPYLVRASETGVRRGALSVDVRSTVRQRRLKAPGRMVLSDLELAPASGLLATFMGVPRAAVLGFLKDHERRIELDFVLEGDVDSPRFALNEVLTYRVAVGMAQTLGLSLLDLAKGIGAFGSRIGNAIGDLFSDDDEKK